MNYRSVADLNADVRALAWELPEDVDRVVGVSRGGRLAASLLHQTAGLPVTDLDDLGASDGGGAGETVLALGDWAGPTTTLVDVAREADRNGEATVLCGAVYAAPGSRDRLDVWADVADAPCSFEWRALHPGRLANACVDIDGVLCRDPTPAENDDGPRYREFLETVEPRFVPGERIGWLVTCRLERYRPETERWLADHGVEYDELVMWDLPDKAARDEHGGHGEYKAGVYEATGADLFVESSRSQAVTVARETDRPVYCFDLNRMIPPGEAADEYGHDPYLVRLVEEPRSFLLAASRHVATKGARRVTNAARSIR